MRIRGFKENDDRLDWYEITDENIKKDAQCVAVILMKNGVIDNGNGYSTLRTKNYGKSFNLCECEHFRDQPILRVPYFTGFLVKENIVATAGHCVNEKNVTSLCIVFGFKMMDPFTPVTEVPKENIYQGIEVIENGCKCNASDWALIKLDRKVKCTEIATLSRCDISCNQDVHVIGYPLGLPLKYTAGKNLCDNAGKTHFTANLNIYSGNSGSPVFNSDTHKVIGIVVRGYHQYFKLVKNCWASLNRLGQYSHEGVHCTKVSDFSDIVARL